MKFISIDYYISGDSNQKYHKKDLSILHQKKRRRERRVQKNTQEIISNIPKGFTIVVVEDKSVFVHDGYLIGVAHISL